jgi:predicted kinase
VRIDSIEHAIRQSGIASAVEDAGYRVAYAVAEDNLRLGRTVVADSVNPWPLTRDAWAAVAHRAGCPAIEIELICSDAEEHRRRVEQRTGDIPGFVLPTWRQVVERDYRPWTRDRLVVDTAGASPGQSVERLLDAVRVHWQGRAGEPGEAGTKDARMR